MPITITWADDTHTLIWCKLEATWSWDDFRSAALHCRSMLASVYHTVDIVAHALHSAKLPDSLMPLARIEHDLKPVPSNVGMVILITDEPEAEQLLDMVQDYYQRHDTFQRVKTVKAASRLLNEQTRESHKKQTLINKLLSDDRQTVFRTIEKLRAFEWLYDGSLFNADLHNADFDGANLYLANFSGASLQGASLRQTNLYRATLDDADLRGCDLCDARIGGASLRGTDLRHANLAYADLRSSDLRGADLRGTNLQGARMKNVRASGAELNDSTVLPDGSRWHQKRTHANIGG